MTVEVTAADGITPKLFVNQRLRNYYKQNFDDIFVAVATPAQLEDFAEDAPNDGSSYYRIDKIDIVSRNADYLESVFDDIVWNVQRLVEEIESLQVLHEDGTYTITSTSVDIS